MQRSGFSIARPRSFGSRGASHRSLLDLETVVFLIFLGLLACTVAPIAYRAARQTPTAKSTEMRRTAQPEPEQVRTLPAHVEQPVASRASEIQLIRASSLISRDLERARRFSLDHGSVVQADFVLGDRRWTMRSSAMAEAATSATLLILSPPQSELGDWRFLAARTLDGKPGAPNFVFFPDGAVQGGEILYGWDTLRASLKLTTDSMQAIRILYPEKTPARPAP